MKTKSLIPKLSDIKQHELEHLMYSCAPEVAGGEREENVEGAEILQLGDDLVPIVNYYTCFLQTAMNNEHFTVGGAWKRNYSQSRT